MPVQPNPKHPKAQAKFRQGLALHEKGQLAQAEGLYHAALLIDPRHAESIHHLGILALQTQHYDYAVQLIRQSIDIESANPAAYSNLGMALEDTHQPEAALEAYDHAIALKPDNIEAMINRGNVLQTLKQWDRALSAYDCIIAQAPNIPDAYNNRGNVLRALSRHEEALSSFNQAIRLKPDFVQAYNNRGIIYQQLKRFDAALKEFDHALALQPHYAQALSNRGIVLKELGQLDQALQSFDQAIALKPDYAQAYGNRGGLLQETRQYAAAYESYDRAIELNPGITALHGKRLHTQMHLCLWKDFSARCETITSDIKRHEPVIDPFSLLSLIDSPELQLRAAQIAVAQDYPENTTLGDIQRSSGHSKIRLGYFSPDFRNHPVSFLTVELFEKHNHDHFELIAFSLGRPVRDAMQYRVATAFDQYVEVGDKSDTEIAALARELGIDIAVDLGGYTIHSRPGVFALRAAPVQIGYIGYLGTMGASYYDYIFADKTLIPPANRHFYTEKIVYLPSYQSNDSQRLISDKAWTRNALNLPETGFVFCCFNNNYKFTPATFDSWMRILKAVPDSVMFLYADNAVAQANLVKEATHRGVEPTRLVFGTLLPREEYLARYRVCDLFLDTLPYNAGTTASDALWAGLPVLTCTGQSFAARMATSLLMAIDLPELITDSYAAYEARAIEYATNPVSLKALKQKLSDHRDTTALFNSDLCCAHIEAALIEMHEREQQKLPATLLP